MATTKKNTAKRKMTRKKATTARKATKKRAGRKATKKKVAKKTSGSRAATVTWTAGHMKKNPGITMTELKKLGKNAGHHVYPLIIGLARAELGWARPKRKVVKRKTATRGRAPGRRGPGRPRKAADPAAAIQAVLTRVRDLEREAATLRKALDRIRGIAGRI